MSPNSSRDGYGLGLSIVQRIARLLEIRIEVSSEPGKGSVFAFELPTAAASRRQPESRRARRRAARRSTERRARRILLVEDEPGVRNAMRMLLKIEGYRVDAGGHGGRGLRAAARSDAFDLLVTDYHLEGGRTGTQVIAAARELLGDGVQGDAGHGRYLVGGARDAGRRATAHHQQADQLRRIARRWSETLLAAETAPAARSAARRGCAFTSTTSPVGGFHQPAGERIRSDSPVLAMRHRAEHQHVVLARGDQRRQALCRVRPSNICRRSQPT